MLLSHIPGGYGSALIAPVVQPGYKRVGAGQTGKKEYVVFYGIRYTKALQDILNTEGGKLARGMAQLSAPTFCSKVEAFTQRQRKWSDSNLTPQDAAITSIAIFGIELAKHGQTPEERLAGTALQMALIDYSGQNPSAKTACAACLTKWVNDHPPTNPVSGGFHVVLLAGDATAARVSGPVVGLSDISRTAWIIDNDGRGALIVTSDDPSKLKARYSSLGFKVGIVNADRPLHPKRPNETAAMVATDLKLSGEYDDIRRHMFMEGR